MHFCYVCLSMLNFTKTFDLFQIEIFPIVFLKYYVNSGILRLPLFRLIHTQFVLSRFGLTHVTHDSQNIFVLLLCCNLDSRNYEITTTITLFFHLTLSNKCLHTCLQLTENIAHTTYTMRQQPIDTNNKPTDI